MNNIDKLCLDLGFVRTNCKLSGQTVVHGVPGCGKTSLILLLSELDPSIKAITGGRGFERLTGFKLSSCSDPERVETSDCAEVVDEYPLFRDEVLNKASLLLCDPFQHSGNLRPAHYVNKVTKRFGASTCAYLRKIGFEVFSDKGDRLSFGGFFTHDPVGTVIAFESEVIEILRLNGVNNLTPDQALGAEFQKVTVYTTLDLHNIPDHLRHTVYICLTRHRDELLILHPDATSTTT